MAKIEKAKNAACSNEMAALQLRSPEHTEIVAAIKVAHSHGFDSSRSALSRN